MLEAGVYCGVREGEAWAAVAGNLRRMGIGTIVLNVEESNAQAVRVYERLGFRQHREYREAVAVRG